MRIYSRMCSKKTVLGNDCGDFIFHSYMRGAMYILTVEERGVTGAVKMHSVDGAALYVGVEES